MYSFSHISLFVIKCIFLGLFYYPAYSPQTQQLPEARFCVEAETGLSIRKAPRIDAERIGIIPFNEEVLGRGSSGKVHQIECQQGRWKRIEYKGVKGYVFDACLSPLEPTASGPHSLIRKE